MKKGSVYAEIQESGAIKTVIDANGGEIMNMLAAITGAVATTMLSHNLPEADIEERIHAIANAGLAAAKAEAKTWG